MEDGEGFLLISVILLLLAPLSRRFYFIPIRITDLWFGHASTILFPPICLFRLIVILFVREAIRFPVSPNYSRLEFMKTVQNSFIFIGTSKDKEAYLR